MIDKTDKKTIDLLGTKKRGRPVTGSAMTPAERKRAQRQRVRDDLRAVSQGEAKYSELTLTSLFQLLEEAVRFGNPDMVGTIAKELKSRAKSNSVTVTKKEA